ncbi:uncharacterized protein LOC120407318 [Mauremys reevesii]|uniref:uncharacterized protein LOC120407318 n=1 Tax=Mauremys reevesii TaxID=260615 RepID=UPI00193F8022|nr:uncharacterized protein LOC120407318 [Mauremys reevesii]
MAKLLRRFRRKALQVPPEPSGRSGHLPKGQSHLSVPAGGEAAPIQARRRKFPAFWRTKPAPGAGADLGEAPTKPRWSWLRMRFCGQDPAQEGRRAGRLWGLLCGQQRPQEPSPHSQQGASPCPGSEDLSAPSDQELEDPSTISSARDSSSAWGSSSSDASGRCCFVPGTPTESAAEEWLEMTTEEDEGQQLSTMKPALEPELESRLLQAALGSVFTLGTETDATDIQVHPPPLPEWSLSGSLESLELQI